MISVEQSIANESFLTGLNLDDAAFTLLLVESVEVEKGDLVQGLPLVDGNINEETLPRALRRLGYEVLWAEGNEVRKLSFPCALGLDRGGYLVALSLTGSDLCVADARNMNAVRCVPIEIVQQHFSGRSFEVLPSTSHLLGKYVEGTVKGNWFWSRVFLQRRGFFAVILATLFANILAVVTSLFALQVYDRVIPGQSEPTLWVLAGGVLLAVIFEAVLRISRAKLIDHTGKEAEIEISSDLFSRVMGMKMDKSPASPGAIVHMVKEFSSVKDFFTNAAVGVVADLPFVFIFLLLIYGIAGNVVWVILAGAVLIVLPNLLFQSTLARLSREALGGMSSASRLLTEVSYGLESVKVNRFESGFQRQWEEIIALNALKTTEQRALRAFLTYWGAAVQQSTYVAAVIACVYMIFAGDVTTGTIIAVGILTTRTLSPVSQLSSTIASWQNMKAALTGLEAIMVSEQERMEDRTYIRRPNSEGEIVLDCVKFSHPNAKKEAINISFLKIPTGTRLAVLGPNGSGKSSLLKLIASLHEPTEGDVRLDGVDLRQLDPSDLRGNIGYLSQEVQMFRGSLRENLSFGAKRYSDADMLEALTFGGLDFFVKTHPEGLDLPILDGGIGLSVGQRQSIGLARLYLLDPSVILLDEPTSALDQNLENRMVSRIGKWIGSRTTIVATHRPLILSEMTHVAVLQEGRLLMYDERDVVLQKLTTPPVPTQSKRVI